MPGVIATALAADRQAYFLLVLNFDGWVRRMAHRDLSVPNSGGNPYRFDGIILSPIQIRGTTNLQSMRASTSGISVTIANKERFQDNEVRHRLDRGVGTLYIWSPGLDWSDIENWPLFKGVFRKNKHTLDEYSFTLENMTAAKFMQIPTTTINDDTWPDHRTTGGSGPASGYPQPLVFGDWPNGIPLLCVSTTSYSYISCHGYPLTSDADYSDGTETILDGYGSIIYPGKHSISAGNLSHNGLGSWNAANLVDGDTGTNGFETDGSGVGSYLTISLGLDHPASFVRCRVHIGTAAVTCIWHVQYSDNGVHYENAYESWDVSGGTGWKDISWDPVGRHPYWRLYKTNAAAGGGYHTELEFYQCTYTFTQGYPDGKGAPVGLFDFDLRDMADLEPMSCSIRGLTDGSGEITGTEDALIEHPADIVRYLCQHYMDTNQSDLDIGNLLTMRSLRPGYKFATVVNQIVDSTAVIDRILAQCQCIRTERLYNGKLGVLTIDLDAVAIKRLRQFNLTGRTVSISKTPRDMVVNNLLVKYKPNPTTQAWEGILELNWTNHRACKLSYYQYGELPQVILELADVQQEHIARACAERYLILHTFRRDIVETVMAVWDGYDVRRGDSALLTLPEGPSADGAGWDKEPCMLLDRSFKGPPIVIEQRWLRINTN